jgi:hypothetical protein
MFLNDYMTYKILRAFVYKPSRVSHRAQNMTYKLTTN